MRRPGLGGNFDRGSPGGRFARLSDNLNSPPSTHQRVARQREGMKMKKIRTWLAIALVWALFLCNQNPASAGMYAIDNDQDGYGVGDVGLKGADADDNDPSVGTAPSIFDKYPTFNDFLRHKGYSPQRIFFIALNGDDQSGCADIPEKPFKNYSKIKGQLRPGDMVVFREGVYSQKIHHKNLFASEKNPIIFLAYPGEDVLFDDCGKGGNSACIDLKGAMHIIVDGFSFDNQKNDGDGNGIYLNGTDRYDWGPIVDVRIRNVLARNVRSGIRGMHNINKLMIENVVIHDTKSHNLYIGTAFNDLINKKIEISDSVFYHASKKYDGRFCIQHNGLVESLTVERNICHSNYAGGGISLVNGSDGAIIRNNLIFNNAKQGIVLYGYRDKSGFGGPFLNNLLINNTIWIGRHDMKGSEMPLDHAGIHLNDSTGVMDILYTNIRNNVIYTQSGPSIEFEQNKILGSSIIKNNVFYQEAGEKIAKIIPVKKPISIEKKNYKIIDLEANNPLIGQNLLANPEFEHASVADLNQPEKFDFKLKKSSPALDFCPAFDEIPVDDDLKGRKRTGKYIDAGCYEFSN